MNFSLSMLLKVTISFDNSNLCSVVLTLFQRKYVRVYRK